MQNLFGGFPVGHILCGADNPDNFFLFIADDVTAPVEDAHLAVRADNPVLADTGLPILEESLDRRKNEVRVCGVEQASKRLKRRTE